MSKPRSTVPRPKQTPALRKDGEARFTRRERDRYRDHPNAHGQKLGPLLLQALKDAQGDDT